jgi:hypothetical protein
MKGKNVIEPGYEAGSEYCTGCKKIKYKGSITVVYCREYGVGIKLHDTEDIYYRCQACLDSEIKEQSPQLEYEKKRFDKHKQSPTYFGDHSLTQSE